MLAVFRSPRHSIVEILNVYWHWPKRRNLGAAILGKHMNSDVPLSGLAAVNAVRKAVETDRDWDVAESQEKLHFYILRAAQNVGRFEPFSEDELALNSYLTGRMAGKRLCDYAWRMLAHSKNS